MTSQRVTVLGSNGHIGHAAMQAFRDAGWKVTGLGRTNRRPVEGTSFVAGDANNVETVKSAIAGADVVVHALHLPYHQWGDGRAEAQLKVVLDAMAGTGKLLMFPGTIYNYRAKDRTIGPELRQSAEAPRGEIRIRLEQMLRQAAASENFRVVILRAGDFYGPGNRGEWFETAMLMDHSKGRLYHLAGLDLSHSWAYLPDLARAFTRLAERRNELAPFENFHFAGHWASHRQLLAAIGTAVPNPMRIMPMPWWLLRAIGLVNPMLRDIYRMRYLWENEMELVDPRLDQLLGPGFATPFGAAVAATVTDLLGLQRAVAA